MDRLQEEIARGMLLERCEKGEAKDGSKKISNFFCMKKPLVGNMIIT